MRVLAGLLGRRQCLLVAAQNLNMPFRELRDPESRARDVTNAGHWGRGDVEVSLSSVDELPYVLGLIHQAFERQIHSADAEA